MSHEFFDVTEHVVPASYVREYADATRLQDDILHLNVKQYTPRNRSASSSRDAVTIIAAAALPFPKELYEPLWDALLGRANEHGFAIRSIWMADPANIAYSGLLNEGKLSRGYSWMDHARDLLLLTNHFRAQMPQPIVAIGHSYGANQLVNVAYIHPRLFRSMILLDPAIQLTSTAMGPPGKPGLTHFTLYQRDGFPDRSTAEAYINKAYKKIDPRVRKLMYRHFIRDTSTEPTSGDAPMDSSKKPVAFITSKSQHLFSQNRSNFGNFDEAGRPKLNRRTHADIDPVYSAEQPIYRAELRSTWKRLPELRPPTLFLLAENSVMKTKEIQEGIQNAGTGIGGSGGLAEGAVEEKSVAGGTHLFPLEAVDVTAEQMSIFLGSRMEQYRREDLVWQEQWSQAPEETHTMPDQRYFQRFKHPKEYSKAKAVGSSKI